MTSPPQRNVVSDFRVLGVDGVQYFCPGPVTLQSWADSGLIFPETLIRGLKTDWFPAAEVARFSVPPAPNPAPVWPRCSKRKATKLALLGLGFDFRYAGFSGIGAFVALLAVMTCGVSIPFVAVLCALSWHTGFFFEDAGHRPLLP